MNEDRKYKQLPLDGTQGDWHETEAMLDGTREIQQHIAEFYKRNKEYNPRQLYHILLNYAMDEQLDVFLGISE